MTEHMDGKLDRDGHRMENPIPGFPEPDRVPPEADTGNIDTSNIDRSEADTSDMYSSNPKPDNYADYLYANAPAAYFLNNGLPVPSEYWTEYERQALLGIGRERTRD